MSERLSSAIRTLTDRLRNRHNLDPRMGFEWEFQLLDSQGKPVAVEEIQSFFQNNPSIGKIYRERGYGLAEITTNPLPPLEAAQSIKNIQAKVANWAEENNYHLSASPIISGKDGQTNKINGSAGLHVNASLVDASNPNGHSVLLGSGMQMNATAANVAHGIAEVNSQTPLWSFNDPETDIIRLRRGDGTPDYYNSGCSKSTANGKIGVSLNANEDIPLPASLIGSNPFNADPEYAATTLRTEERFPNARADPAVAAFRTLLGQYHGLENPQFQGNTAVDSINFGAIPDTLEDVHCFLAPVISAH